MVQLTKRQSELAAELLQSGFIPHRTGFGTSQRNRPLWTLVDKGIADFAWGPTGSFLQVQGFVPRRPLPGDG